MNKLNLVINLDGIDFGPEQKDKPESGSVTVTVLKNIMFSYAQGTRGLTGEERRQYYRITEALDTAVKAKQELVEIEDTDAGFLKKCKRECRMMPSDALQRVEVLIDAMVKL